MDVMKGIEEARKKPLKAPLDSGGYVIHNLAPPISLTDAATKRYVDETVGKVIIEGKTYTKAGHIIIKATGTPLDAVEQHSMFAVIPNIVLKGTTVTIESGQELIVTRLYQIEGALVINGSGFLRVDN